MLALSDGYLRMNAAQVARRWCLGLGVAGLEDGASAVTGLCVWAAGVLALAVWWVPEAAPETDAMMITITGMTMVVALPTHPFGHRYLAKAMYATTIAARSQSDSSIGHSRMDRHPHPPILELIQNGPGRRTPSLDSVPSVVAMCV